MPTAAQATMMDQSYSISIEGLNHVAPKWSNRSSKVGHLVFSSGQWCAIAAYQIPSVRSELYVAMEKEGR